MRPDFQYFTSSSHSSRGGDGSCGRDADVFGFERTHERLVHRQRAGLRHSRFGLHRLERAHGRTRFRAVGHQHRDWRSRRRQSRRAPPPPAPPAPTPATRLAPRGTRPAAPAAARSERTTCPGTADGTRDTGRASATIAASDRRSRHSSCTTPGRRENQHDRRERGRIPRIDERPHQRERRRARIRIEIQHFAGGEIFAGLGAERREIGVRARRWRPAAECPTPGRRPTNITPPPIIAPATPRPMRSISTSSSSGTVNHTVCDRKPMLSAARNAPITIIRPDAAVIAGDSRRSPSGPGVCRHHAEHQARLRGQRQREPRQIAHRPDREIPEQRARRGDRGRRERREVERRASRSRTLSDGGASAKQLKTTYRQHDREQARRAATAPRAPSPRSSTAAASTPKPAIAVAIFPRKM